MKPMNRFWQFAERTQPGGVMIYGRGEHPPLSAVREMRPLVDAGVLAPVARRVGTGEFVFMVQRCSGGQDTPTGAGDRSRISQSSLAGVMDYLALCAVNGATCPSNAEIALRCGLTGVVAVGYRLKRLVDEGQIAVDIGRGGQRTILLLAGPRKGVCLI